MLLTKSLQFAYGKNSVPVINGMDLSLRPGNIYGLLGPNGAGKSTLLYLLCGLLTPSKGYAELDGINTRQRKASTLREIFIVPEEFSLPNISLKDYVAVNAPYYPRFSMEDMRRYLGIFQLDENIKLGQLSMGQKKRVFLSFALACNTKVLLLDEPSNGLDIPGKSQFRKFLLAGMTDEKCIVISTHQVHDVENLLDHILLLENNKLMLNCSTANIIERLRFVASSNPEMVAKALYARPGIPAATLILKSEDFPDPTDINLESFCEWAFQNPEEMKAYFHHLAKND